MVVHKQCCFSSSNRMTFSGQHGLQQSVTGRLLIGRRLDSDRRSVGHQVLTDLVRSDLVPTANKWMEMLSLFVVPRGVPPCVNQSTLILCGLCTPFQCGRLNVGPTTQPVGPCSPWSLMGEEGLPQSAQKQALLFFKIPVTVKLTPCWHFTTFVNSDSLLALHTLNRTACKLKHGMHAYREYILYKARRSKSMQVFFLIL